MKVLGFLFFFIFNIYCCAQKSDFGHIDFKKADSIAKIYKGEDLYDLPNLSYKLTSNLNTDVEKFRAIYKWVCENIANDYNLYLKHKRKRNRFKEDSVRLKLWNEEIKRIIIQKLLKNGKTICTGYAYLVKELANFAGLHCTVIHGYGRTSTIDITKLNYPNHSWNAVKLKNDWYLCDATWASGIPDPKINRFNFQYNDGYFLAEPELFAVDHLPVEKQWLLLDDKNIDFERFIENPVIYGKAYEYLKLIKSPIKMNHTIKKNDTLIFDYKLIKPLDSEKVRLIINNGKEDHSVKPNIILNSNLKLTIEHIFEQKGFFDVHLLIDSDLISTYTVRVKT